MASMDTRKLSQLGFLGFTFILVLVYAVTGNDPVKQEDIVSGIYPTSFQEAKPPRYLLYDVNPGEGFNLRRDVYMRVANLVKVLNEVEPWILVLPPWGRLYHWASDDFQVPWSTFFDLTSLGRHVPVIEFHDYLQVIGSSVDEVYYLQNYAEGWTNGKWEQKMDFRDCIDNKVFTEDKSGNWHWWFWGYSEVVGKHFQCISIQAQSTFLKNFLTKETKARSVFLYRAEELIHGEYSEWSPQFWTARRSLVFSKQLRQIGDEFRKQYLHSTDETDLTVWEDDWTNMKRKYGDAVGGPYLAVHLRRRDFLYSHKNEVPSIYGAAQQLRKILKEQDLDTLFVATDAPDEEYHSLKTNLGEYHVFRYKPAAKTLKKLTPGGVAIVDQWICAHAKFFVGTATSTFSYRIHEEREILGFQPGTTFNCLCEDTKTECEQPSKWLIKYS